MSVHELDDLYKRKREIEDKIDEFFNDGCKPDTDNVNYNNLLTQLDKVEDEIEELEYS